MLVGLSLQLPFGVGMYSSFIAPPLEVQGYDNDQQDDEEPGRDDEGTSSCQPVLQPSAVAVLEGLVLLVTGQRNQRAYPCAQGAEQDCPVHHIS